MPSGPVARDTFEYFWEEMRAGLERARSVDGLALGFHGSMVATGYPDSEGEYLERFRALVGPDLPIAVSLDLHCNVTPRMARHATILTAYRTAPHVDIAETSARAGKLLERAMAGDVRPHVLLVQPPTLIGVDQGRTITGTGPMVDALAMARAIEADEPDALDVSVHCGFPWSDVYNAGPSIAITATGNDDRLIARADEIADEIWRTRDVMAIEVVAIDAAIALALQPDGRPGPLLIGEFSDTPAAGTYGDATNLLRAMIEGELSDAALAPLFDPEAVDAAHAAGIGAHIDVMLGGRCDPLHGGPPLAVTAHVAALSADGVYMRKGPYETGVPGKLGRSARLDVGGVSVIVCALPNQVDDREMFRLFGLEPERLRTIAAKSLNHFRADFGGIGRDLVYVDGGGIASLDFASLGYTSLRRPIWPLDKAMVRAENGGA